MNISLRKINAIFILKLQLFLGNLSLLMIPAMAIGYVVIFKNFFPANTVAFKSLTLNMGILLNIIMGGIMFGAYPIAEEKEHHTLGVLMTSSINATEYFIGNLLPALLILTITNIILVPLNGTSWNQVSIINYLIITVICSIISILIGFTLGLFPKIKPMPAS
jgi:ABC-2 type transport system permease protein